MSIQQAVFTSVQSSRGDGYQLTCRSEGVSDAEARELTAWGPSHDSLTDPTPRGRSVNFFQLSSGAFSISRTVASGEEYSERGGCKVCTRYLLLSRDELARFSNNPFALLRAALAAGAMEPPGADAKLWPLMLGGRAPRIDHAALYRLSSRLPTPEAVRLITACFEHNRLVLTTDMEPELLLAGLVNSLPLERRTELSFSTGLRFSAQRPFRLVVLPPDATADRRAAEQARVAQLELCGRSTVRTSTMSAVARLPPASGLISS